MKAARPTVEVINSGLSCNELKTAITQSANGSFLLHVFVPDGSGTVAVASSASADKLSRWAFDAGALEVTHDYDMTSGNRR